MTEQAMTSIDTHPLYNSADDPNPHPRWWLPEAVAPRQTVTFELPEPVVAELLWAQENLGIAASDLAALYIKQGALDSDGRRRRNLRDLYDHKRIKGWMPDGTPVLGGEG